MKNRNTYVEFHALTSYPVSNLNRDREGRPKTAILGGHERLRISSQSLKRAWRMSPWMQDVLGDDAGFRTAIMPAKVLEELTKRKAKPFGARAYVEALAGLGKKLREEAPADEAEGAGEEQLETVAKEAPAYEAPKTSHLLYLSKAELEALVQVGLREAAELDAAAKDAQESDKKGKQSKKAKDAQQMLRKRYQVIRDQVKEALAKAHRAPDIALFGRWVTSDEIESVDGALQAAHALGVSEVEIQPDFLSAVDDLNQDRPGAGFIGEAEFATSTVYKYACVDLGLLVRHLDNDPKTASAVIKGLANTIPRVIPKGMTRATAPWVCADYFSSVVRHTMPLSLINAFERPIQSEGQGVMVRAIQALRAYERKMDERYAGRDVIARLTLGSAEDLGAPMESETYCQSVDKLADAVGKHVLEFREG